VLVRRCLLSGVELAVGTAAVLPVEPAVVAEKTAVELAVQPLVELAVQLAVQFALLVLLLAAQLAVQPALVVLLLLLLAVLECGACNVHVARECHHCTSRSLALDTATCAVQVKRSATSTKYRALMRLAVTSIQRLRQQLLLLLQHK
jgi:hypothetical protein